MSEAETLEILYAQQQAAATAGMDALSIFFAYVVCAYLVGGQLSKTIAVGVTVLYSVFIVSPLLGFLNYIMQMTATMKHYVAAFPANPYGFDPVVSETVTLGLTLFPLACAWVASVLYMHLHVRRISTNTD